MLELKVGDRVRSMEDGVTGTVVRREHDFEHPRYVIACTRAGRAWSWASESGTSKTRRYYPVSAIREPGQAFIDCIDGRAR